jgi:voltage-gated potassium channel
MDETDGPPGPTISRRIPAGRAWYRFLRDPSSVRRALRVIIAANLTVVVIAGLLLWLLDPKDYPNVGLAFWYILQTVTTVGYGDATPTEPLGRLVGAIVMLTAIGFLSIITASITSAFVDAR